MKWPKNPDDTVLAARAKIAAINQLKQFWLFQWSALSCCKHCGRMVVAVLLRVQNKYIYTQNHLMAFCLGLSGWAGIRRNTHPLTPILIIRRPLSTSSIYYVSSDWLIRDAAVLLLAVCINIIIIIVPSVLWHCWLGGRKGIRPVKNWVVGCWHSYLSGARCRLAYGPADATATHCLLLQ